MAVSTGSMTIDPMAMEGKASDTECHDTAPSRLRHTPPFAEPIKTVLGFFGLTATVSMRPPTLNGPAFVHSYAEATAAPFLCVTACMDRMALNARMRAPLGMTPSELAT